MSGDKVNSNLEQFLVLTKSARGAAAVTLVKQALEASNLYVFGELLDCPSIKQLDESPDHKPYIDLLRLFAYGSCKDYLANRQALPELTPNMMKKLRLLTLISLAAQNKHLSYGLLLKELDLHNMRELEDLIIEAIYSGVIKARLDQMKQILEVEYALGRDVQSSQIPELLQILSQWMKVCDSSLTDIKTQIVVAQEKKAQQVKIDKQTEAEISNIKKTLKLAGSSDRQQIRPSSDMMDTEVKPAKKSSKTRGLRGSGKLFKTSN